VLPLEVGQRRPEVEALLGGGRGECALPEALTDDRRGLQQASLEALEGVEPGREQRLDGARQRLRLGSLLLQQTVHHLLREQRVAAGALRNLGDDVPAPVDPPPALRAAVRSGEQRGDQLARLSLGERLEGDRGGVAPAASPTRPALEQLVTREADEQKRCP